MNKDLLGIGGDVPPGQEAVRLLDPSGTFETSDPYLLVDARSLIDPIPFEPTVDNTYTSSDGSLQSSWGAPPPVMPLPPETPVNAVTHIGSVVTYNGAIVTNG